MKILRAIKDTESVGGDQLEQLTGKLQELLRAKEGAHVDVDALLASKLQELFGYRKEDSCAFWNAMLVAVSSLQKKSVVLAPAIETRYAKWRTFLTGEANARALLSLVPADCNVRQLLEHEVFTTCGTLEAVETIILTPGDFGYDEDPTMDELLDPVRLATWSEMHAHLLPPGYEVGLIPVKPSLHVCIQFRNQEKQKDQSVGERVLSLGMERVQHPEHGASIFEMGTNSGERWFEAVSAYPDQRCALDRSFVFLLSRIVREPELV